MSKSCVHQVVLNRTLAGSMGSVPVFTTFLEPGTGSKNADNRSLARTVALGYMRYYREAIEAYFPPEFVHPNNYLYYS